MTTTTNLRAAFTLLELMVVLVLISVITAGVAVSFQGTLQNAKLENAFSALKALDQRMRYNATLQSEMGLLVLDLSSGRFHSIGEAQEQVALPSGVSVTKVYVSTQSLEAQKLSLPYFPNGASVGWAVGISNGDIEKWMLVSGRSGQVYKPKDEDEVSAIFEMLSQRPDAD